jgi:hypothetical protein
MVNPFGVMMYFVMLLQQPPQSPCSLTIHLADSKGRPVNHYVTVVESGGRHIEKKHSPGGARFCDLGILPVKVEVRPISASCTWTYSELLDVRWAEERSHTIIVPSDPCERHVAYPLNNCAVLFRIKDEDGKWLGGSRIVFTTPTQGNSTTDQYGRALLRVQTGAKVTGKVMAPDHHPAMFDFTCGKAIMEEEIELIYKR